MVAGCVVLCSHFLHFDVVMLHRGFLAPNLSFPYWSSFTILFFLRKLLWVTSTAIFSQFYFIVDILTF